MVSTQTQVRELMQADIDGSQVASDIALLYSNFTPGLLSYACMHIASREDAEDLVVEVFLAANVNAKFATLPEKAQQLWLWRIARNKVIDVYRRSKTRQSVSIDYMTEHLFEDEVFSFWKGRNHQDLYVHLERRAASRSYLS
jgi:DNA-directed RNA polymerase specialized sigma24 family protein